MKSLKKIIYIFLILTTTKQITIKKTLLKHPARKSMTVVPTGDNTGHNYSTTNPHASNTQYIQIPSTHPCYQNCMSSLTNGSHTGGEVSHQTNAQGIDHNDLNQYPDQQYKPEGVTGELYNGLNGLIQGGAALIGNTMRGGAQLQMSVVKGHNDIAQTQMQMEQMDRMNNLDYQNTLNKKEIDVQTDTYNREAQSPVYGNQGYDQQPYRTAVHGSQAYKLKII